MAIATSTDPETTERILSEAFVAAGYEPPSPGKPAQVELRIRARERGSTIHEVWVSKSSWATTVGRNFAREVARAQGWVLLISLGSHDSQLEEWDAGEPMLRSVPTPAAEGVGRGVARREDAQERMLIETWAQPRVGAATRKKGREVCFRVISRAPFEQVAFAVEAGVAMEETTVMGRPAFRFEWEDGRRVIPLSEENAAEIRRLLHRSQ